MATAPSAGRRDGGIRSAYPQILNTASGRSSPRRRTGADTPHSAGSSSPADTAYPQVTDLAELSQQPLGVSDSGVGEPVEYRPEHSAGLRLGQPRQPGLAGGGGVQRHGAGQPVHGQHGRGRHLVDVDQAGPPAHGQDRGLAGLGADPLQHVVGPPHQAVRPGRGGEPRDRVTDLIPAGGGVPVHQAAAFQGGQQAPGGGPVDTASQGQFSDRAAACRANGDGVQQRDRPFDGLHPAAPGLAGIPGTAGSPGRPGGPARVSGALTAMSCGLLAAAAGC